MGGYGTWNLLMNHPDMFAGAVPMCSGGDPTKASLSSRLCAELYQLQVLKSAIQNRDNNYTRFICIAKEPKIYSGADRTSIMINIPFV